MRISLHIYFHVRHASATIFISGDVHLDAFTKLCTDSESSAKSFHSFLRDYTNPDAREYWATSIASLFNELGAEACQWDGAE